MELVESKLTQEPQTSREIGDMLGMDRKAASARLGALVRQGRADSQHINGVSYYYTPGGDKHRLRHPPDPVAPLFNAWLKA